MAAKLKVFVTSDGLTEYAVAATSRPKALAAWGVHQDLFASGAARESDDPALMKAASAKPGEVIERRADGKGLPKLAKAAPKPARRGPSKAALARVKDLEARLEALEDDHRARLAAIERERAGLARRETEAAADYEAGRDRLSARLSTARAALRD